VQLPRGQLLETLGQAAPALILLPGAGAPRFLALAGRKWRRLALLASPDATHRVPLQTLAALLAGPAETEAAPEIEQLLARANVQGQRRIRARRALLVERLSASGMEGVWLLRLAPGANGFAQMVEARLPVRAAIAVTAHAAAYALWLLAWWTAGRGVLADRFDRGWLLAWALLLQSILPLRWLSNWAVGRVTVSAGALLKQRLLAGALAIDPDRIRREGVGQLLARVIESEALESLALGGGITGLTAWLELAVAALVLAQGAGGTLHALLLLAWLSAAIPLGLSYFRRRERWTHARLGMTHELVERMVGQRTRLCQEPQARWHAGEDLALGHYHEASKSLDESLALFSVLLPRGWMIVGTLGLMPSFVAGSATPEAMAVALAGVLLAYRPLQSLVAALSSVAGASIAGQHIGPLSRAAAEVAPPPPRIPRSDQRPPIEVGRVLLDAHELVFRHRPQARAVLNGVSLRIAAGDRVLIEGASGGGKSTLSALLCGLREPESGLLLLDGLDRRTIGPAEFRRRVACAPQFHENHVLSASFAFNLLLARPWPPTAQDLLDAETLCRELGLAELIARMPGGLEQMLGETGWQLSHGEKSRLFLARALLQRADIVILDESFSALDPENLGRALACAMAHAPALVVVAHP